MAENRTRLTRRVNVLKSGAQACAVTHCANSVLSLNARHDELPSSRQHPYHRFRQPGYAADRAARPRGRRLLRDRALSVWPARPSSEQSRKASFCPADLPRGSIQVPRRRRKFSMPACRCWVSAMASRRCARRLAARSSRPITANSAAPMSTSRTTCHCSTASGPGRAPSGVDEPWRPHERNSAGLQGRGTSTAHLLRRLPMRSAILRDAVSPGSGPHARWRQAAAQLRACIAGLQGDWTMASFRDEAIHRIRKKVGFEQVICGLSGGVDSSVAAVLIHEAIGEQLTCIFVDHGLMRKARRRRWSRSSAGITTSALQVDASDRFSARSKATPNRRQSARPSDGCSSRSSRRRRRGAGGAAFPRARHALSRCDRERFLHRRALGHHQIASQCRRASGAHEHEAHRTVARIVQGRGARFGRELGLPEISSAAIRFRALALPSASPARSRRRSSTSCARRMRSISTRSARPGSTTRSGRLSRYCSRYRRLA